MATRNERIRKSPRKRDKTASETEGAPAGRGGVAMGRTVGLPFGGARARKRKPKNKRSNAKTK